MDAELVRVVLSAFALAWLALSIWLLTKGHRQLRLLRQAYFVNSQEQAVAMSQYNRLRQLIGIFPPADLLSLKLRPKIAEMIQLAEREGLVRLAPTVAGLEVRLFGDRKDHDRLIDWWGAFTDRSLADGDFPIVYAAMAQAVEEYRRR